MERIEFRWAFITLYPIIKLCMQVFIYPNWIMNVERSGIMILLMLNTAQTLLKWAFATYTSYSYLHKYGLLILEFKKI